jgi:Camelysin metallo-endopeptidase
MLSMHRIILASVLVVGVLSTYPQGQTRAYLTTAVNSGNTFTAGNIQIGAGIAVGDTLTMSNLVPGDVFSARLTIQNSGNLDLHYAMTTTASGDATLASTLQLTIQTTTNNACSAPNGAIVYGPGNLSSAAIGSTAHGLDPGDQTVTAGSSQDLCFKVALPGTAPLSVEGKSIGATFSFAGEQ